MLLGLYVYCLVDFVWGDLLVRFMWLRRLVVCWLIIVLGRFWLGLIWLWVCVRFVLWCVLLAVVGCVAIRA